MDSLKESSVETRTLRAHLGVFCLPHGEDSGRSASAAEASEQSRHSRGSDSAHAFALGFVLRGQQRISTTGTNTHTDRTDSRCDV